jgi:hypothetical protein
MALLGIAPTGYIKAVSKSFVTSLYWNGKSISFCLRKENKLIKKHEIKKN